MLRAHLLLTSLHPIILLCYLLAAILYTVCGLSIDQCGFLLPTLQFIVRLAIGQNFQPDPEDYKLS
jgi:hypothetical protein